VFFHGFRYVGTLAHRGRLDLQAAMTFFAHAFGWFQPQSCNLDWEIHGTRPHASRSHQETIPHPVMYNSNCISESTPFYICNINSYTPEGVNGISAAYRLHLCGIPRIKFSGCRRLSRHSLYQTGGMMMSESKNQPGGHPNL